MQSLKFKDKKHQIKVCQLFGKEAKSALGIFLNMMWKLTGKLWWNGTCVNRDSDEYQLLLDRAFGKLAENDDFITALNAAESFNLTHSIGEKSRKNTILTEYEFISRLERIHDRYIITKNH